MTEPPITSGQLQAAERAPARPGVSLPAGAPAAAAVRGNCVAGATIGGRDGSCLAPALLGGVGDARGGGHGVPLQGCKDDHRQPGEACAADAQGNSPGRLAREARPAQPVGRELPSSAGAEAEAGPRPGRDAEGLPLIGGFISARKTTGHGALCLLGAQKNAPPALRTRTRQGRESRCKRSQRLHPIHRA